MDTALNRCVIVGAAPVKDPARLAEYLRRDDFLVAADGGWQTLCAMGQVPALMVADFDSFPPDQALPAGGTEVLRLPVRKDETDTLAAVQVALARGFCDFLLLGCLGGRLDHTLGNIQVLAALAAKGCRGVLADEQNEVMLWQPGTYRLAFRPDRGFSLLAYDSHVTGVTIRQAAYPLTDGVLTSDYPLGVSNAFLPGQDAQISFETGRLLVFLSKD